MHGHIVLLTFLAVLASTRSSNVERELIQELLADHDVNVRPVNNVTDTMVVEVGFVLLQILNVDQSAQTIEVTGYLKNIWQADTLRYDNNPKYSEVTNLHLNPEIIWTPDMHVMNAVSPPTDLGGGPCLLSPDGKVMWVTHVRLGLTCEMEEDQEKKKCHIKYGTWTYNHDELTIQVIQDTIDAVSYTAHHDWELFITKAEAISKKYPCCDEKYDSADFSFVLERIEKKDEDADAGLNSAGKHNLSYLLGLLSIALKLVL